MELTFGSRTLGPNTVGAPEYIGDGAYRISYVATKVSERQHTCSALHLRVRPGTHFSGVGEGAYAKRRSRDNVTDWGVRYGMVFNAGPQVLSHEHCHKSAT